MEVSNEMMAIWLMEMDEMIIVKLKVIGNVQLMGQVLETISVVIQLKIYLKSEMMVTLVKEMDEINYEK